MSPSPASDFISRLRRYPSMMLGGDKISGRSKLVRMLIDAAAFAAMEGRGDEVDVRLERGGSCTFTFNGTLWPAGFVTEPPVDSLARRLTLADVSSFGSRVWGGPDQPYFSLLSAFEDLGVINVLCSWLEVTHRADGGAWRQSFRDGASEGPPRVLAAHEVSALPPRVTRLRFLPDRAVFPHARFSRLVLSQHLLERAALTAPVGYRLYDETERREYRYRLEHGLSDYVTRLTASSDTLHAPWFLEGRHGTTGLQLALQWRREAKHLLHGWVNLCWLLEGAHVRGLRQGLLRAFRHVRPNGVCAPPTLGLVAVMKLTHPAPELRGSACARLDNDECQDAVRELVREGLIPRLEAEPELVERILSLQTSPDNRAAPFIPLSVHGPRSRRRGQARP